MALRAEGTIPLMYPIGIVGLPSLSHPNSPVVLFDAKWESGIGAFVESKLSQHISPVERVLQTLNPGNVLRSRYRTRKLQTHVT